MKAGQQRKLIIASELGHGAQGSVFLVQYTNSMELLAAKVVRTDYSQLIVSEVV